MLQTKRKCFQSKREVASCGGSLGLKRSVLLLSLMALSVITRAEVGNVNRDEDLGQVVSNVPKINAEGESSADDEVVIAG